MIKYHNIISWAIAVIYFSVTIPLLLAGKMSHEMIGLGSIIVGIAMMVYARIAKRQLHKIRD